MLQWAAYFGEPQLALDLLTQIASNRPNTFQLWQPVMSGVRKLPGFKNVVRQLGLVDYWRAYGWPDFCRPAGEDFACS